mmetsp:Transcript_21615/g.50841  ORF Transcript_21615/g.50841 Transcript_21615/m.50841 type:complete len:210 (-) Transcript_21615:120-749(-)
MLPVPSPRPVVRRGYLWTRMGWGGSTVIFSSAWTLPWLRLRPGRHWTKVRQVTATRTTTLKTAVRTCSRPSVWRRNCSRASHSRSSTRWPRRWSASTGCEAGSRACPRCSRSRSHFCFQPSSTAGGARIGRRSCRRGPRRRPCACSTAWRCRWPWTRDRTSCPRCRIRGSWSGRSRRWPTGVDGRRPSGRWWWGRLVGRCTGPRGRGNA